MHYIQHICKAAQRGLCYFDSVPDFGQLVSMSACAVVFCSGRRDGCREFEQLMRKTSAHKGLARKFVPRSLSPLLQWEQEAWHSGQ